MQREIWKWIFHEMKDEDLYNLVEHCGVKIKGFRNLELSMMKNIRTKCMKELLKSQQILQVKLYFQNEMNAVITRTKEELIQSCMDKDKAVHILAVLLSSTNKEHTQIATEIYEKMTKEMKTITTIDNEHNRLQQMQILIEQFEEKIKKQEKRLGEMGEQSANKSQELLQKDKEVKKYERDAKKYKRSIEEVENSKNELENELSSQRSVVASLQEELEKKEKALHDYEVIMRQCEEEIHGLQIGVEIAADQQAILHSYVVIGDVPKQKLSEYPVLSLDQVKMIDTHTFADYEFVCLLRFSLPPAVLRSVKKALRPEQIKEFYTLEQFIQWERLR